MPVAQATPRTRGLPSLATAQGTEHRRTGLTSYGCGLLESDMEKQTKFNLWYVAGAFIGLLLVQGLWSQSGHMTTIPYSEFESYLAEGKRSEERRGGKKWVRT